LRKRAGAVIKYMLYDGHGSIRQLVDNNEDVKDAYSYDGYGVMLGANPANAATSLLYTGEMYDSSASMYCLRKLVFYLYLHIFLFNYGEISCVLRHMEWSV